jgi:hypothetical protein
MICRFGGHSQRFYSVAQHSVHVSERGRTDTEKRWGLLHDATEAYVGDMIRPLKLHMPEFREVEDRILFVIAQKFDLALPIPSSVKEADEILLATEAHAIMGESCRNAPTVTGKPDPNLVIEPWLPPQAEWEFMNRFSDVFDGVPV